MLQKSAGKWPLWSTCRRAGLQRVGWHVLRHTLASQLVMRGVRDETVQELLGHATVEMTIPDEGFGAAPDVAAPWSASEADYAPEL